MTLTPFGGVVYQLRTVMKVDKILYLLSSATDGMKAAPSWNFLVIRHDRMQIRFSYGVKELFQFN